VSDLFLLVSVLPPSLSAPFVRPSVLSTVSVCSVFPCLPAVHRQCLFRFFVVRSCPPSSAAPLRAPLNVCPVLRTSELSTVNVCSLFRASLLSIISAPLCAPHSYPSSVLFPLCAPQCCPPSVSAPFFVPHCSLPSVSAPFLVPHCCPPSVSAPFFVPPTISATALSVCSAIVSVSLVLRWYPPYAFTPLCVRAPVLSALSVCAVLGASLMSSRQRLLHYACLTAVAVGVCSVLRASVVSAVSTCSTTRASVMSTVSVCSVSSYLIVLHHQCLLRSSCLTAIRRQRLLCSGLLHYAHPPPQRCPPSAFAPLCVR